MHQIFYIAELVEMIVQAVADRRPDHYFQYRYTNLCVEAYNSVQSLGLTAKVFREASLDAIWHTQKSLVPLFLSVNLLQRGEEGGSFECCRSLEDKDMATFLFYSSRIKTLMLLDTIALHKVDPAAHLSPTASLFSFLRRFFDFNEIGLARTDFVMRTSSESLQVIGVMSTQSAVGFLRNLDTHISRLRALYLRLLDVPDIPSMFSALLQRAESMENITVSLGFDVSPACWNIVAQLPHLSSLSLHLCTASSPTFARFSSLVKLMLAVENIASLVNLLQMSQFPLLKKLSCYHDSDSTSTAMEVTALVAAISFSCSPSSLISLDCSLTFDDFMEFETPVGPVFLSSDVFLPLLRFPLIREFRIDSSWSLDLDDAFIHRLAKAWPKLEALNFGTNIRWPNTHRITLHTLDYLVKYCVHLENLEIVFDTSESDVPGVTESDDTLEVSSAVHNSPTRVENTKLTLLSIGPSRINPDLQSCARVAAHLSRLFPSLKHIRSYHNDTNFVEAGRYFPPAVKGWVVVARLLSLLSNTSRSEDRTYSLDFSEPGVEHLSRAFLNA